MSLPTIPPHKMESNTFAEKHLYYGMNSYWKKLSSGKMMMSMAIAERVFHYDIRSLVKKLLLDFHQFEFDCEQGNTYIPDELDPATWGSIDYVLSDVYRVPNINKNGSPKPGKINRHHILSEKGFVVEGGKIVTNYNKARSMFVDHHPVCYDGGGEKIIGVSSDANIMPMLATRHNKGLNSRYPGNMLPHHQLLAEIEKIDRKIRLGYKSDCSSIQDLYRLLSSSKFEDLYREESYIVR